uniref:Uncharacterized protein n=1 Tax=Steinernema glaseri TaxID=37863 RepID=A0A1I7ZFD9_9BILA
MHCRWALTVLEGLFRVELPRGEGELADPRLVPADARQPTQCVWIGGHGDVDLLGTEVSEAREQKAHLHAELGVRGGVAKVGQRDQIYSSADAVSSPSTPEFTRFKLSKRMQMTNDCRRLA